MPDSHWRTAQGNLAVFHTCSTEVPRRSVSGRRTLWDAASSTHSALCATLTLVNQAHTCGTRQVQTPANDTIICSLGSAIPSIRVHHCIRKNVSNAHVATHLAWNRYSHRMVWCITCLKKKKAKWFLQFCNYTTPGSQRYNASCLVITVCCSTYSILMTYYNILIIVQVLEKRCLC